MKIFILVYYLNYSAHARNNNMRTPLLAHALKVLVAREGSLLTLDTIDLVGHCS